MAKSNIVTGLDIGTSSIKCLVVQKRPNECEVLSCVEVPSFGIKRGAVDNVDEVAKNVQLAISNAEKECGQKITSVLVNIGGNNVYVIPSDGIISVSRADQRISKEDVDRVIQATKAINLPKDDEVLDVIEREFIVDDRKGVKHPLDLTGVRLEAKVLLLCVFSRDFLNLTQAVLNSKVQINDVIPSSLAASNSVLTPQQKELGVAMIDIGAVTTTLSVFEDGDLIHLAVFPIGSSHITNDIAIGLKTEVSTAESIKKQHGTCIFNKKEKEAIKDQAHRKIEIIDKSSDLSFSKKELVDIIEPRVSEILDLIQKELKKIGKHKMLPGGVVLIGGGVKLPRIKELTKEFLELNCEIGFPKGIMGVQNDPALATVAGLVIGGVDFEEEPGILGVVKALFFKIKKFFRNFIP